MSAPPPIERDANMPDWLSLDPTPAVAPEGGGEEAAGKNKGEILPDWLIQSVKPEGAESIEVDTPDDESG